MSPPRGTRKVSSADLGAIAAAFGTAKGMESKPVYEDVVRGLGNRSRGKAFVQALRDEGLTPHLEKDDDTFVNSLFLPGAEIGLRDADVTPDPDPVFGVAEVFFAPTGHMLAARVGDVAAAVGDLAAMGAGRVRRLHFGDAMWGCFFPADPAESDAFQWGVQVPPPAQILAMIAADSYAAAANLLATLTRCLTRGIRVTLTPWHAGGGANAAGRVDSAGFVKDTGRTWEEIAAWHPRQQDWVCVPSADGWDEWYWDEEATTFATDAHRRFEQYGMHVWPIEADRTLGSTDYTSACARRKGLAIVAFSTGLAGLLSRFDAAMRRLGVGTVYDVVEFIELGNELDGMFVLPAYELELEFTSGAFGAMSSAEMGAREAGRYMALLAGPLHVALPELKFRASELLSSASEGCPTDAGAPEGRLRRAHRWLTFAITEGMASEVARWKLLQSGFFGPWPEGFATWKAMCDDAGFYWPPLPRDGMIEFDERSLVHGVGYHWYHCYDSTYRYTADDRKDARPATTTNKPYLYHDTEQFMAEFIAFRRLVVRTLESRGFSPQVSVGEIAFPHADPREYASMARTEVTTWEGADDLTQGAMLARGLLVIAGLRIDQAYWFDHMPLPTEHTTWPNAYGAMGLRQEHIVRGGTEPTFQASGAYALPAWYSYRRVVWLTGLARTVEIVHASHGAVAIRLTLRTRLAAGPDGAAFPSAFKYAWVLWVDQFADSTCHHEETRTSARFALGSLGGAGYRKVSLVPQVAARIGQLDVNGYLAAEPDWTWTAGDGWDGAILVEREDGDTLTLTLGAATSARPAPICVFCDATEVEVA